MPEGTRTGADTTQAVPRPAPGPCLGRWTIVELLGEGTWSLVYRARPKERSERAPSDYAVKVAKPSVDPALALQLLRREARVGQSLSHPHLACVLAAHLRRAPHYLLMPFIAGVSLQTVLTVGAPLPLPHALWIARQVAEALQALHEHGWLHGDVKPANILVASDGHATLRDLSLAVRAEEANAEEALTGTLVYAAPEVFGTVLQRGPASDVYSLGVTLYQLLTGELPFPAGSAAELAQAHLHEPPPDPRLHNPRVTNRLARLLKKLLAKQPAQRPTGAALVAWLADLEIDTFGERSAA
jgi:serine/threonine protein kinase